jgi:exodeoxyribonuclease-3
VAQLTAEGSRHVKVVTVNVNGIRAAHRRGGLTWLAQSRPDVICLQEVRATRQQLEEVLAGSPLGRFHVAHQEAPQLGRAGVAILTKREPIDIREDFRDEQLGALGRWVEVDIDSSHGPVTIASVYVHTGEAGTSKQDEKYAFLEAMEGRLRQLRSKARRYGSEVLIAGDLNIAREEIDIKNWRGNLTNAGFLPEERAYLQRWFKNYWIDLGRHLGGDGPGPYTWWSWRGRGFDTDGGWRIDYQIASPGLAKRARRAVVGKAASYAERWSDHAPLTVQFTVPTRD